MNKRLGQMGAVAAVLLLAAPVLRAAEKPAGKPVLTVSAAASLKEALGEINARYTAATVRLNLGASGGLQRQIEQGAPVDVFISAAARNMDALAAAKLVDTRTRRDIAANRLVLVVPATNRDIHSFRDLDTPKVRRFAMGAPDSVPAGAYAREALTRLGLYARVQPKAVLGKDVRAVLTQVALGNVEAGVAYRTDALSTARVRIAATAEPGLHRPILYPAAVVSDSRHQAAARAYVRFLGGPVAQRLLQRHGFGRAG